MNYSKIKKYDIANGLGLRCSVFFCGCTHACKGCFNSELWDFKSGKPFDDNAKQELFDLIADEHCKGLSVLGGEPLMQGRELLELLKEVREKFPTKDIWLWTGYYLSELNPLQQEIISQCDVVVDGRFEEAQSDRKLRFRGSSNQTIWENKNDEWVKSELN